MVCSVTGCTSTASFQDKSTEVEEEVGDEEESSEDVESTEETSSSDEEEEDGKGEVRREGDDGRRYTVMCSVLTI